MRTGPEAAPTFSGPRLSFTVFLHRASDTGAMPPKIPGHGCPAAWQGCPPAPTRPTRSKFLTTTTIAWFWQHFFTAAGARRRLPPSSLERIVLTISSNAEPSFTAAAATILAPGSSFTHNSAAAAELGSSRASAGTPSVLCPRAKASVALPPRPHRLPRPSPSFPGLPPRTRSSC